MDEQAVKLRRYQNTLVIIGMGVIMFGVWSVIRTIVLGLSSSDSALSVISDVLDDNMAKSTAERVAQVILMWLVIAAIGFVLALRIYVGLSARAEVFGKRRGSGYLIVAIVMIVAYLISILINCFSIAYSIFGSDLLRTLGLTTLADAFAKAEAEGASRTVDYTDLFVSFVVDITSLVTLIELVAAAIQVKRLSRQLSA